MQDKIFRFTEQQVSKAKGKVQAGVMYWCERVFDEGVAMGPGQGSDQCTYARLVQLDEEGQPAASHVTVTIDWWYTEVPLRQIEPIGKMHIERTIKLTPEF